ncbi:Uncharacterised protein [Starkeya nomas]|uniref:Uncharacterized protein n=1 Tax=Starkeya nomas TaxID=2666134 RepID=A0A5S9R7A6_9HYPH|nr:Uncharacterised protein [Starkeya nomas]
MDALVAKKSKGEALAPTEQEAVDKDPELKKDVEAGMRGAHRAAFAAQNRVQSLEQQRAAAQREVDGGTQYARGWLNTIEQELAAARAELDRLMSLPGAKEAMATSMQGVANAVATEGEQAVQEASSIADRIRSLFNFTVTPTISPQFAPGSVGAPAKEGAPVPLPPSKPKQTSSISNSRSFAQTNHITVNGASDPRRSARAIDRQLARLGSGAGALNDTVG